MAAAATALTTGNTQPTTQQTTTQGAPAGWWDSVKDSGTKDWLKSKNFPDSDSAFTSYRNLEQLFGADKAGRTVMLPKDDNDADGWSTFNKRIGVPESLDGYKLPVPEGGDDGFARTASQWFMEAGVPPRAAAKIAEKWNAWLGETVKAGETSDAAESDRQMNALKTEWGAQFPERQEMARRGYRAFAERFGLGAEASLDRAESIFGAANLTKFFAGLGELAAEDTFAGGDGGNRFTTSAQDAQREITEINQKRVKGEITDDQWRKVYGPRKLELGKIIAAHAARNS